MAAGSKTAIVELQKAIRANHEDSLYDAILRAGDAGAEQAIPLLIKLLKNDERINIKNAAAIALRELEADEAVPILVSLIRDSRFRGRNGTFVYALQTLNWEQDHGVQVGVLVADADYEVRKMALEAIRLAAPLLSPEERTAVIAGLSIPVFFKFRVVEGAREMMREALEVVMDKKTAKEAHALVPA